MKTIYTIALAWALFALLGIAQESAARNQEQPARRRGARARREDPRIHDWAWRNLGPAVQSGRIVDVAVHPDDASLIYAASGSGGLWRTTNRGTSWTPIFDDQPVMSIGAIALSPSRPDTIWLGSGEANNQRSSYWGNGVYKSEDAGKSWSWCGLPDSHHIGRIVVHPKDPDRVYVAALGHLYSPNEARGLYRSTDGGKSWERILRLDEDTGVVDVCLHPENPEVLLAASYQRRRRAWNFDEAGPGSGLWRSENGGDSWTRMGEGFPDGRLGRIGVAFAPSDPAVCYAVVENSNPRPAKPKADDDDEEEEEAKEAPSAGGPVIGTEIYRSDDAGKSWRRVNEKPVGVNPPYYYGQIRVDPSNRDKIWVLGVRLFVSDDGGKSFRSDGARGIHVDHHALWIDPADPQHMLLGNDGGLATTYDGGRRWDVYNNLPLGQFYAVAVDERRPYRVLGGTQDNGSYLLPSQGATAVGILDREVFKINGGDGFYCAVDPEDPLITYSESQFGNPARIDLRTMERRSIRPPREKGVAPLRFNWMTPFQISPHNPRVLYIGSQFVHRSEDRGDHWERISEDLTTDDELKTSGNVPHCTITSLCESPLRRGLLWAGSDDGQLWITHDGGRRWSSLGERIPKEARGLWVSRIEASAHAEGRAYLSLTGYREDRFAPYLFVTENYGATWTPITQGLPKSSPVNVVREDPKNEDLLFVGTEHAPFYSVDRGASWLRLGDALPPVAVHDLVIAKSADDVVIGTHGRGIWVLDVAHLRHLGAKERSKAYHLNPVKVIGPRPRGLGRGWPGARLHIAPNPRVGATISVSVRRKSTRKLSLEIRDSRERLVRLFEVANEAGVQRFHWNFRRAGTGRRARLAPAGSYVAVFVYGDKRQRQVFELPALGTNPDYEDPVEGEEEARLDL